MHELKRKRLMKTILILLAAAVAQPAQAGLAVKNFREIFDSFVVSTGVDPSDPDINAYYSQSFTRLPMTGAVTEVSSSDRPKASSDERRAAVMEFPNTRRLKLPADPGSDSRELTSTVNEGLQIVSRYSPCKRSAF